MKQQFPNGICPVEPHEGSTFMFTISKDPIHQIQSDAEDFVQISCGDL